MKTYIKPNTEIHHISAVLMQATSPAAPAVTGNGATTDGSGYYDEARIHSFGTNSLWESDEEE